ncbi:late competence protein ComER [Salipaludibacillus sp. CF4.18]|uniref:late competence protein ComER n=1 Tax=Salipaludibacillus sp. CF4.18 TaxID=3373081 RepID=UPI003EE7FD27
MKNIGFIGTGSMGSLIIEAFIKAKYIPQKNVHMLNRTMEKPLKLQEKYKKTTIHQNVNELLRDCEWIFLCVKPHEMVAVLESMKKNITTNHIIITITSPLQVEESERILQPSSIPVVRFIPSIVNLSLDGPSLVTFGSQCTKKHRKELWEMFSSISRPQLISPPITRVASDIASCGPAFLSFLLMKMIKGATDETEIDEETALKIMERMIIGYGETLRQQHFDLETLKKRVTVPGGVTGVGLKVLEDEVGMMFHHLFRETEKKYREDRRKIVEQIKDRGEP